jgi:Rrf2 family transcriptional regulator, iron-sulfur cluster assembly transcription factor
MRLTTKGRCAVTAMTDLALREHQGAVALSAISARQEISLSYLEQLFGKLRREGLVESIRGPGGGYVLGRDAEDITVADIIVAVDAAFDEDAESAAGMGNNTRCHTTDLWAGIHAKMLEYLHSIKLKRLVEDQLVRGVSVEEPAIKRAFSSRPVLQPIKVTGPNSVFALAQYS